MAIYVAGPTPVFGPAPEPPPLPPPAGPGDAGAPEAGGAGAGPAAALAWLTAWDSDADADDFLQTAAPRLAALAAASAGAAAAAGLADSVVDTSERPAAWRAAADDAIYAIERRGTLVALLLGAPAAALPSLTTMLDGAGPRRGREDRARRARDPGRTDQGRSGR